MRLHHLEVTAFGPFPGTERVDFDDVARAGLFLVHGPTGAGKTTLLDAVCFALFAATPGARPGGRALRSDHAPRDAVPTVRLELTAAARRLRLTRSPEFRRPKKRGAGETTSPATVALEEWRGGGWHVLSTRNDEVAEVVDDVLGMGLAQFARVVLLPQGDFAAFLRTTAEERRRLLERLFDVSDFTALEHWFAEERRAASRAADVARGQVATGLARFRDVLAGVDAPGLELAAAPGGGPGGGPGDGPPQDPEALTGQVEASVAALESVLAERLAELDAAQGGERTAAATAERARTTAERRRRGLTARERLVELEARAEQVRCDRSRVEAADRAAGVGGELAALDRARADLDGAAVRAATARAHLPGLGESSVPAALLADLERHDEQLADLRRRRAAARVRAERAAGAREALAAAATESDRLTEEQRQVEADVTGARSDLTAAREVAADLPAAESAVADLAARLALRSEVDRLTTTLEEARARLRDAVDTEQVRRDRVLDLREARLADLAGQLAEHLADGEACPVCGAREHPQPAAPAGGATAEDVAAAEDALGRAAQARERSATEVAGVEAELRARTDDLGPERRDAGALAGALATARAALRQARDRAAAADEAEQRLAHVERRREELRALAEEVRARSGALSGVLDEHADLDREDTEAEASVLATHADRCPCRALLGAGPAGQLEAHEDAARSLRDLVDAERQHEEARRRQDQAAAAAAEAATTHGFPDLEAVERAALPREERERLRAVVADHDTRADRARATLDDPDVAAALDEDEPDVEAAEQAAASARAATLRAGRSHAVVETAAAAAAGVAADVRGACADLGPAARRQAAVAELADLVAGTSPANTYRMRLSSFVLAARLERVVEIANERLAVLGDGRFQLLHDDGPAARGARSGLGLAVRDLWTGRTRDTATLSGGESFMASLALALALADAVREESGGLDLQTLFVDEGFGTLDEESLEEVMGVLDSLRDGGRAVGVVSHVTDLRSRIPSRVAVTKTPAGSTVTTRTGGMPDDVPDEVPDDVPEGPVGDVDARGAPGTRARVAG